MLCNLKWLDDKRSEKLISVFHEKAKYTLQEHFLFLEHYYLNKKKQVIIMSFKQNKGRAGVKKI